MKIRLLTSVSCEINGSHRSGSIVEWPDEEAARFIERGYAEAVEVRETAAKRGARERAAKETPESKE